MNFYKKMSEMMSMPLQEDRILVSHTENGTELLGPYRRFVIWVHGCCFDCEGCLAENTKNGEYVPMSVRELADEIIDSGAEGITVSGGEPFLQAKALTALINRIRCVRDMGVIIYSGFTLEQLYEDNDCRQLLDMTDILIDGRYIRELDDGRAYIGSSNQKLYYLSDRYAETGKIYYSAPKRRAEIKFMANRAVLIGVPSANVLHIWEKVKEKSGGIVYDF